MNTDVLFVVNQDIGMAELGQVFATCAMQSALLLSTHHLFPTERNELMVKYPISWRFMEFAEVLSDAEMARCDEESTQVLYEKRESLAKNSRYVAEHQTLSRRLKNERIIAKLSQTNEFKYVYYAEGLGIDGLVWASAGGKRLKSNSAVGSQQDPKKGNRQLVTRLLRHLMPASFPVSLVYGEDKCYIFATSIKRLNFDARYGKIKHLAVSGYCLKLRRLLHSEENTIQRLLKCIPLDGREPVLCTTIHEYSPTRVCDNIENMVFVDGFHPSNYSRSYLDSYGDMKIVVDCPLNAEWFSRHGFPIIRAPRFIKRPVMKSIAPNKTIQTVLLALNHAGDWSSLINRSDTDRLVEAFVHVAEKIQGMKFIVRSHPTMDDPAHEGLNASSRLRRFCSETNIANLEFSNRTLEDDLCRSDLCVSEYSQVLIEAMRRGMYALIVNMTGRRSYMVDYEQLGFPSVSSVEEFEETLLSCMRNPMAEIIRQNDAKNRYNDIMKTWFSEAVI